MQTQSSKAAASPNKHQGIEALKASDMTAFERPLGAGEQEVHLGDGKHETVTWELRRAENGSGLALEVRAPSMLSGLVGGISQAFSTLREYCSPKAALTTAAAIAAVEGGFISQSRGSLIVQGQLQTQEDSGMQMIGADKTLSLKVLVPGVGVGYVDGSASPFIGPDGTAYAFIAQHAYRNLLQFDPNPTFQVATGPNYMTDRGTVFTATHLTEAPNADFAILTLGKNTLQGSPTHIGTLALGDSVNVGGFGDSAFVGDQTTFRDGQVHGWKMEMLGQDAIAEEVDLIFHASDPIDGDGMAPGKGLNKDSDDPVYDSFGNLDAMLVTQSGDNADGINGAVNLNAVMPTISQVTGYNVPEPASMAVVGLFLGGSLLRRNRRPI